MSLAVRMHLVALGPAVGLVVVVLAVAGLVVRLALPLEEASALVDLNLDLLDHRLDPLILFWISFHELIVQQFFEFHLHQAADVPIYIQTEIKYQNPNPTRKWVFFSSYSKTQNWPKKTKIQKNKNLEFSRIPSLLVEAAVAAYSKAIEMTF